MLFFVLLFFVHRLVVPARKKRVIRPSRATLTRMRNNFLEEQIKFNQLFKEIYQQCILLFKEENEKKIKSSIDEIIGNKKLSKNVIGVLKNLSTKNGNYKVDEINNIKSLKLLNNEEFKSFDLDFSVDSKAAIEEFPFADKYISVNQINTLKVN